jgi:hypothetical protein
MAAYPRAPVEQLAGARTDALGCELDRIVGDRIAPVPEQSGKTADARALVAAKEEDVATAPSNHDLSYLCPTASGKKTAARDRARCILDAVW